MFQVAFLLPQLIQNCQPCGFFIAAEFSQQHRSVVCWGNHVIAHGALRYQNQAPHNRGVWRWQRARCLVHRAAANVWPRLKHGGLALSPHGVGQFWHPQCPVEGRGVCMLAACQAAPGSGPLACDGGVKARRSSLRCTMTCSRAGFRRWRSVNIHRVLVSASAPDAALRRSSGMCRCVLYNGVAC